MGADSIDSLYLSSSMALKRDGGIFYQRLSPNESDQSSLTPLISVTLVKILSGIETGIVG